MPELNDTAENPNLCIIDIGELCVGMYVNRVCAQLGHVNLKSSGVVKSQQVVAHLVDKGVLSVEIDLSKGETSSEVEDAESATQKGITSTDDALANDKHLDNLEEISLDQFPATMNKSTLRQIVEHNRIGVNVVGLKRSNGEYEINPGPDTELDGTCKLFVLGTTEQIRALNRMIKHAQSKS